MRNTWTIACKEFRGYVSGPSFYFIAGLYTTLLGFIYFMMLNQFIQRSIQMMQMRQMEGGGNIHREIFVGHISTLNLILLFLVPFLTVRLLAEERKMRTFDLLLTCPITATEIVLGKFFAVLAVSWVLVALSMIYPIVTSGFTKVQWPPLVAAYAGMMLLSAVYVAIGLFASSLTENLILAGFVAIIMSLGLWFIGSLEMVLDNPIAKSIAGHISVSTHFGQFLQGSLQIVGFVFFLSVVALNCFLTQRVVESARWR